ncbi:hypothetical protein C1H46_008646 [Malus baccata]|uniref:Uncharacterized protein n=1 Tax=Malus baccata TaxID=106549 RepID=A0A540N5G3_MALBA|nr:hypothetical protein C1H46_008646 [Malus baccata]
MLNLREEKQQGINIYQDTTQKERNCSVCNSLMFSLLLTGTRRGEGLCRKSYENSLGIRVQEKGEIKSDDVSLSKTPAKFNGMVFAQVFRGWTKVKARDFTKRKVKAWDKNIKEWQQVP